MNKMLFMSLAQRLGEVREACGISSRALSLAAGLSQSVVGQIERGDIQHPTCDALGKIVVALRGRGVDVTIDSLIFGDPDSGAPETTSSEAA